MEQNLPVEPFQSVKEDNLFKQTVHSGKVPVGQSKYACSILLSIWNHRNFHVNGKQPWFSHLWKTWLGNNACFLVCLSLENMARKQYFLVCSLSENIGMHVPFGNIQFSYL
jgi:hypothetical protein